MTRQVLYVAHPVAPCAEDLAAIVEHEYQERPRTAAEKSQIAVKRNVDRALRWLAWLRKSFPETTFIAPWIATIQSLGGDGTPEEREAGLVDDCAVVERCDGIVLVGGRISSGMRREMEHGQAFWLWDPGDDIFWVHDLTKLGHMPPFEPWGGLQFIERFGADGSWR